MKRLFTCFYVGCVSFMLSAQTWVFAPTENYIVATAAEKVLDTDGVEITAPPQTHVVTVDYVSGKFTVDPVVIRVHVGDQVQYRTPEGEVIVRALNKYNDDGISMRSEGGTISFTQRNVGKFLVGLQLARDGAVVGWQPKPEAVVNRAPDHVVTVDYRNGSFATPVGIETESRNSKPSRPNTKPAPIRIFRRSPID